MKTYTYYIEFKKTWYDQAMSDYEADEYTNDELTKDYNEAN